ncbi:MAG: aminodeoxychorismate/anthranilate synthase component II [Planctomycetaceae bacterium]|nr:aminodeoxychorismate/anthranilate synthase component II [Planctomycetaceae bacterium]
MILLIDNYDSFVFNLARYLCELGCDTRVVRNDAVTVDEVRTMKPHAIVISPGPCSPNEAGISVDILRELGADIPMLGVCLGHQSLAAACGGKVVRATEPVHGRTSWVRHASTPLFAGVTNPFRATRYHSLIVDKATLPSELVVTAWTDDGVPMAIEHQQYRLYGLQFHPESVLTEFGHQLLANFLRLAGLNPTPIPGNDRVTVTKQFLDEELSAVSLPLPTAW